MEQITVFLSYARADDDPNYDDATKSFMRRLSTALTAGGFGVWWDRVSLPSRSLAFTQEIEDAIRACERFILVVGPGAAASDYVRAEYEFALRQCKPITPILRAGDFDLIPKALGIDGVNAIDCRAVRNEAAAFADIAARLRQPAPIGGTVGVQPLPRGHITRADAYQAAFDALQADAVQAAVISAPVRQQSAVALFGLGGVGKSTLAAALAHDCLIRRYYHDGIIWVEVGQTPQIATLQASLGALFGDSRDNYPDERTGALSLARVLRDRTALIVLDDVWDHRLVERFPVNGTACRLLITTRSSALAGHVQGADIRLGTLTPEEGGRLIANWTGGDPADPDSRAITDFLGGHTLAVKLAAAQIANRYADSPADMLRLLEKRQAEGDPFRDLAVEADDKDLNLSLSLSLSYGALEGDDMRRRFRALGVFALDGAFTRAALAAAWGDVDEDNARAPLKALEGAGLLEAAEGDGRYRQHRLLRAHARALLDERGAYQAAAARHFEHYHSQHSDHDANNDEDRHPAIGDDWENIQAALAWGLAHEPRKAVDWVTALQYFMLLRRTSGERLALLADALAAARQTGHTGGEADCLYALGEVQRMQNEYEAAAAHYEQALALYRASGERLGEANCLRALGEVHRLQNEYEAAVERYQQALALYRAIGGRLGEAHTLWALGEVQRLQNEYEAAVERYQQALPLYRAIGERLGEAHCLRALGKVHYMQNEDEAAAAYYEQALALYRAIGDRLGEADCLRALGDVHLIQNEYEAAAAYYEQALALGRAIGDFASQLNSLRGLADAYRALNDLPTACAYARELLALADSHPFFRAHSLTQSWRETFAAWGCV